MQSSNSIRKTHTESSAKKGAARFRRILYVCMCVYQQFFLPSAQVFWICIARQPILPSHASSELGRHCVTTWPAYFHSQACGTQRNMAVTQVQRSTKCSAANDHLRSRALPTTFWTELYKTPAALPARVLSIHREMPKP